MLFSLARLALQTKGAAPRPADGNAAPPPGGAAAPQTDNTVVPPSGGAWRVFGVNVSLDLDGGKDDYSVSAALVSSLEEQLGVSGIDAGVPSPCFALTPLIPSPAQAHAAPSTRPRPPAARHALFLAPPRHHVPAALAAALLAPALGHALPSRAAPHTRTGPSPTD